LQSQQKIGIEYTVMTEEMDDDNIASLQMNMNNTSTFEESFKEEVAAVLNVTISTLTVTAEEPVVTKKVVYVTVTETVPPTPMPTTTSAPGAILTTTPFKSIPATTTSVLKTTTAAPRFCPFQYTNLDAKNPCLLNVCQNSTDNMACKDGISIYCLESKHVNNGVIEKGCVVILAKSATTTTTTRAPEPVTTTTTVSDHCPYKYFTLDATNPCHDIRCKAENMNNTECMKSVRDYCSASKMVHNDVEGACINVVKVPQAPTCPFKYFDLIDATNPCDITSCNINSAGEICKNAVVVYCTRSKEEKGDVEVGCLTVGKNSNYGDNYSRTNNIYDSCTIILSI
jgi:hypothetical protein